MSDPSWNDMEPHAPDVAERETLDGGFSRGLGLHFQPSEAYWLDAHTHLRKAASEEEIVALLDQWFARVDAYRLGRLLALVKSGESFPALRAVSEKDDRFDWLVWLEPDNPDVDLFKMALDHWAVGLKLHNAPIMRGLFPHDIWLNEKWAAVFRAAEEAGVPVLWHVTQRLSAAPYHGGGLNAYWEEGWKRGVTFTNEDLLQVTLEIMRRFPRLKVQGAHQLHVGPERLAQLFDEFENLVIDSSCTMFVRWADVMYDRDREVLRAFVLKYADRILFGTDAPLAAGGIDEYLVQGFLCHARFFHQLRLPDPVLQMVSHENAERLYGLRPLTVARRGNYRP